MQYKEQSDDELFTTYSEVGAELNRRAEADAAREVLAKSVVPHEPGAPWAAPSSPFDSYMTGDEIVHEGETWVSTFDFNVGLPGVSGWRLKPVENSDGGVTFPPFVQPAGAHDRYMPGERITWTDGDVYEVISEDGTAYSPSDYAAHWHKVVDNPPAEEHDESQSPPQWGAGVAYVEGAQVIYNDAVYRVRQAHTSQAHWTPDAVPALYEQL